MVCLPRGSVTNGVTDTRTFDLDYRMTSVKDVGTGNIQYLSYGYDADNNVTSNTDHVTPADNQTFHYDLLSRISFASGPYGTVSSITYDSNSNRLAYGATAYVIPGSSNRMSKEATSSITTFPRGISAPSGRPRSRITNPTSLRPRSPQARRARSGMTPSAAA